MPYVSLPKSISDVVVLVEESVHATSRGAGDLGARGKHSGVSDVVLVPLGGFRVGKTIESLSSSVGESHVLNFLS